MPEEIDIVLDAVGRTFPTGTSVGLYRGVVPNSGVPRPTGAAIATATVSAGETLTFEDIPKDQPTFYAAALFGEAWRIIAATTTAGEPEVHEGPQGPEGREGPEGPEGSGGAAADYIQAAAPTGVAATDTAALKAALAAAVSTKRKVKLQDGTYLLSMTDATATLKPAAGTVIEGNGRSTIVKTEPEPGTGTMIELAAAGRYELRSLTLQGPDTYRAVTGTTAHENGDDPRGVLAGNADSVRLYCQDVYFKRLTVGAGGWNSKKQTLEFVDCEFDGDNIGLHSGTEKQAWVFGILTAHCGPVITRNCWFHNIGSDGYEDTEGHSHDIYVCDDTALMVSDCRFEEHIAGHNIQSNGPAETPSGVPYYEVADSYFGKHQVEGGSGQGENIRTGKKHRALISGCELRAERGGVYVLGDVLIDGCYFANGSEPNNNTAILFQTVAGDVNAQPTNKHVTVSDCVFDTNVVNDIYVAVTGTILDVKGCHFLGVGNNAIKWQKAAATGYEARITDCVFANHISFNLYVAEGAMSLLKVADCDFSGAAYGLYTEPTVAELILSDNYFHGQSNEAVHKGGTVTAETSKGNVGYADVPAGSALFDVTTYGAKGDGATNDSTAIQAAITAAEAVEGGVVWFPPGTYIVGTTLTYGNDIRLLGAGWSASVLKAKASSNIVILEGKNFATTGIKNASVEHLMVDGNKANNATATHGIKLQGQNCYFHKVIAKNCRGDGFRINLTTETAQESTGLDNGFTNCRAIGCEGFGFYINAHDTTMQDCQAIQCKEAGFEVVVNAYMYYCHSWCYSSGETVCKTGFNLHGDVQCVNCVAEGASVRQVLFSGALNRWISGEVFDSTGKPNVPCFEFIEGSNGFNQTIMGVYVHNFGTGGAFKFNGAEAGAGSIIDARVFDPEGKAAGVGTPDESVNFDIILGGSTALGTLPYHRQNQLTLAKFTPGAVVNNTLYVDNATGLLKLKDNGGTLKTLEPEPVWIKVVTFTNSWAVETNQFKISYRKVGDRVEFQGAIKGGTTGLSAFILPAGFRPAKLVVLQAWNETVEITTAGEVKPIGTGIANLTGQSFSTAAEPA